MAVIKYRRIPIIVEALRVRAYYKNLDEITKFVCNEHLAPIERRIDYLLKIETSDGEVPVRYGDYIVKSESGELSVISQSDFESIYEMVEGVADE